tara:strand:- start:1040 stop:1348 length:309 start_codon:yes stop_codon:yes gene_type:complete
MWSKVIFSVQWLFIGGCSAIDAYLSIKLRDVLYESELNPLGRLLLELGDGDVALFMGAKFAGTVLALGILILVWRKNEKIAHIVIASLSVLHLALLVFLLFG